MNDNTFINAILNAIDTHINDMIATHTAPLIQRIAALEQQIANVDNIAGAAVSAALDDIGALSVMNTTLEEKMREIALTALQSHQIAFPHLDGDDVDEIVKEHVRSAVEDAVEDMDLDEAVEEAMRNMSFNLTVN